MKKQIHFATTNPGKVASLNNILSPYDMEVIQVSLELPESRTNDVRQIAKEKALFAYNHIKKPCIALDAGFYIHSLNGFPRVFTNFALKTIGVDGLLKLTEDKSKECEFHDCLAYFDGLSENPIFFESTCKGKLVSAPRGQKQDHFWSDLFFVFIPEGLNKTLAEMTYEEYKSWDKNYTWRRIDESGLTEEKFVDWLRKK